MTFHVGQKVECIKAFPEGIRQKGEVFPSKGMICTIRAFHHREDAIYLAEIRNPLLYGGGTRECAFSSENFRPIVECKTDISIFTAMLNPSQVMDDALNTADFARESAG